MVISSFSKAWTMKSGGCPSRPADVCWAAGGSRRFVGRPIPAVRRVRSLVSFAVKEVRLRRSNLIIERARAGGVYPEGVPTKDSCAVGGEGSR